MANLKGPGSMKAVNLIAVTYPNNRTKDGKSQYMDVQIDARDSRGPEQSNLHLVTQRVEHEGKTRINNGAPYSAAQFEQIKAAAGTNFVKLPSGAEVYAVKADVMPAGRNSGLVLNSKSLAASEHTIDAKVLDNQFASAKAAKEARAASQAAEAEAQAQAPQAEAAEAKVDEPALA